MAPIYPGDIFEHKKDGFSYWSIYHGNDIFIEVDLENDYKVIYVAKEFSHSQVNRKFDDRVPPFKDTVIVQNAVDLIGVNWKEKTRNWFQQEAGERGTALIDNGPRPRVNSIISEHFAKWCRYGVNACSDNPWKSDDASHSNQLNKYKSVGLGKLVNTEELTIGLPSTYVSTSRYNGDNAKVGLELLSLESSGVAKLNLGVGASAGFDDGDGKVGVNFGIDGPKAQAGPVELQTGLRADTGFTNNEDGVGVSILGTGIQVGRKSKISIFGNSFTINF